MESQAESSPAHSSGNEVETATSLSFSFVCICLVRLACKGACAQGALSDICGALKASFFLGRAGERLTAHDGAGSARKHDGESSATKHVFGVFLVMIPPPHVQAKMHKTKP